ncbi:hypothetical protein [Pseudoalteromonas sp. S16_S37]|uniref:hypothetical protein n=1 Tax=Pseudoalteromonas sp. S16_S37 TaxID=2720228 RepID=UPI0016808053|nr:hypothetical protein [Pseudoalteromonas sp. S16_S37]MBD1584952.1 hypothetical protein [Pseudoalteromonas sp. S16_S37]
MNTTTSLEQIKAQFDHWRHNKDTLGTFTPVELRRQAVELTQEYSVSKVVTTLGLSGSVIKRWRTELKHTQTTIEPMDTFIALPTTQQANAAITSASIILNDGTNIHLNGEASAQVLSVLAQALTVSASL